MNKYLKWTAYAVLGLVVLGALLPDDKAAVANDAEATIANTAALPTAPPIKVTARDLFKAYEANEIAADSQYKGKRIEISGQIESIASDMFDEPLVQLSAGNFQNVGAQGLTKDVAAKLTKGQSITLVCNGAGEAIGTPMLDKCAVK